MAATLVNELIRAGYTVEREVSRIESFEGKKLPDWTPKETEVANVGHASRYPPDGHSRQKNKEGFFLIGRSALIDSGADAKSIRERV